MLAYRCLPSPLNANPEYSVCLPVVAVRSSEKSVTTPVRASITASDCSYFDSNVPYPAFTVTTYRPSGDTAIDTGSEFTLCGLPGTTPTICLLDGRSTTADPVPCASTPVAAPETISTIQPNPICAPLHTTHPRILLALESLIHSPYQIPLISHYVSITKLLHHI